jgi:hypothetical protein
MLTKSVKLEELEETFYECLHRNLRYKLEDLESALFSIVMAYNTDATDKYIERARAYLEWMLRYNLDSEVRAVIEELLSEIERVKRLEDGVMRKRTLGELIPRTQRAFIHLAFKCMLEEL